MRACVVVGITAQKRCKRLGPGRSYTLMTRLLPGGRMRRWGGANGQLHTSGGRWGRRARPRARGRKTCLRSHPHPPPCHRPRRWFVRGGVVVREGARGRKIKPRLPSPTATDVRTCAGPLERISTTACTPLPRRVLETCRGGGRTLPPPPQLGHVQIATTH